MMPAMKAANPPFCHRGFFPIVTVVFLLLFSMVPLVRAQLGAETVQRFIYAIYQNDTNTAWRMLESNTNLAFCAQNRTRIFCRYWRLRLREMSHCQNASLNSVPTSTPRGASLAADPE
jgi:hypothetical protein